MACKHQIRALHLTITTATLLICIFDVIVDWFTFTEFNSHKINDIDRKLTIACVCVAAVGSFLFLIELRNSVVAFRMYSSRKEDIKEEERSLERWQEVTTFLQVLLEDLPMTIILYMTFNYASCPLNWEIFENTFFGNLALLAAFVSASWKCLTSLCYCCCGRRNNADHGCCISGWSCCCCFCRSIRTTMSILVLSFAAYLFFTINKNGLDDRDAECARNQSQTASMN